MQFPGTAALTSGLGWEGPARQSYGALPMNDTVNHQLPWPSVPLLARWFAVPTALSLAIVTLFQDPTYRFPFLTLVLPMFLRGAAIALGVYWSRDVPTRTQRFFVTLGFAGFAVGWLLMFGLAAFTVVVMLLSIPGTGAVIALCLSFGGLGFIVAAAFWWPWYARNVLQQWPRSANRLGTASSNRWQRLLLTWRMQQMRGKGLRLKGFGFLSGTIVAVMALTIVGGFQGVVPRIAEILLIALLIPLHLLIVKATHEVCTLWQAPDRPKP